MRFVPADEERSLPAVRAAFAPAASDGFPDLCARDVVHSAVRGGRGAARTNCGAGSVETIVAISGYASTKACGYDAVDRLVEQLLDHERVHDRFRSEMVVEVQVELLDQPAGRVGGLGEWS